MASSQATKNANLPDFMMGLREVTEPVIGLDVGGEGFEEIESQSKLIEMNGAKSDTMWRLRSLSKAG